MTNSKWCTNCRAIHPCSEFGLDATRGDGLSASCLASRRVKVKQRGAGRPGRRGWDVSTRDGDKLHARRRVNYLVESGQIPKPSDLPCMDCGDEVYLAEYRHEYDHARGYDGENQLYVEPVCSRCHHNREDARHGLAA